MNNPGKPTFCEYVITIASGLVCFTFFVLVALYCSSEGKQNVQIKHNKSPVLSTQTPIDSKSKLSSIEPVVPDKEECNNSGVNPAFEHAIKDAENFEKSIQTKDTLPKRVWHRLTHREEASRAAIILTAIAILLFIAMLLTKMWKDKEHYPLTMKQVVSYPQDDRKSEMLVKEMLRTRARSFISFFDSIYRQKRKWSCSESTEPGVDQTDKCPKRRKRKHTIDMERFLTQGNDIFNSSKYREIICSSSDEDGVEDHFNFKNADEKQKLLILDGEGYHQTDHITTIDSDDSGQDQIYAIDALTGEWKGFQQQPNFTGENLNDISMTDNQSSSVWKAMSRKAIKTSLKLTKKMQDKRSRTSYRNRSDYGDGSTIKLLNEQESDESEDDEYMSLRHVDSSTDTSTNFALG